MMLLHEVYKNLSLIFRNLSSLMLLIIGPLLLILLIGFAFSGTTVHGVVIGVLSEDAQDIDKLSSDFRRIGEIREYDQLATCIHDMKLEKAHICMELAGEINESEDIPTSHLTVYYDNTRKRISSAIVKEVSEFLGVQAEQISIASAESIFSNIQAMVVFLKERDSDITDLVNESATLKTDLLERKARMILLREAFLPRYEAIKDIHSRTKNISARANKTPDLPREELKGVNDALKDLLPPVEKHELYLYEMNGTNLLTSDRDYLEDNNISFSDFVPENLTFMGATIRQDGIVIDPGDEYTYLLLREIEESTSKNDELLNSSETDLGWIEEFQREFDATMLQLDMFKGMLDTEIESIDTYVAKIDAGVVKVKDMQLTLSRNLDKLSMLTPGLATKLVRPILQTFEPIAKDLREIKVVFPTLLSLVIVFISLLFSNIVTLSELNSKAYLRNLIAPVTDMVFTLGLVITNLLVVLFQVMVLLLVAQYRFMIDIFPVIPQVALVCVIFALSFIFLGMILAYLFKSEQTSILVTTFSAIGFFMFSDSITPLETMPVAAAKMAAMNPFVIAQALFKKIVIFRVPLGQVMPEILILAAYMGVLFILLLAIAKYKNLKRI